MADLGIKVKLTPDGKESDFQKAVNQFKPKIKIGIDRKFFVQDIKNTLQSAKVKNFTIPLKTVIDTKKLSADVQKALNAISVQNTGPRINTLSWSDKKDSKYLRQYQEFSKKTTEFYEKLADLRKLSTSKDADGIIDKKSITNAEQMLDKLKQLSVQSAEYKKAMQEAEYAVNHAMKMNKAALDKSLNLNSFSMSKEKVDRYQRDIENWKAQSSIIKESGMYEASLMDGFEKQLELTEKIRAGTERWASAVNELRASYDALKRQSTETKKANAELEKYKQTLERVKNWTNTTEARALVPKSELEQLKTYISSAEAAGQNTKQWRDEIDKASEAQKRMAAEISKNSAAQSRQNSMMSGATHANNIYSQISGILDKNPRIKENIALYEEFLRIQRESLKLDPSNTEGWRKLSQDLSRAKAQMNELGLTTETLGQRLVRLFKDHFNTAVAMAALHALQNALIGIYQNVKDIDRAMTDLRKVSSGTAAQYSEFLSSAADRAKNLGATISDVVDASAEFSRLGFNLDQSSVLGDAAVMYKNVSEYENIEDAAQSIVSTMQAFGVEAKDVMTIVDRFNEVGNNFAISSEGLGEAMKRSAAALALAGNSLDESLALVTGANEVVDMLPHATVMYA